MEAMAHPEVAPASLALTCTVILREEECSPVLKEQLPGLLVQHRCQIPVPDPRNHSQYAISVRVKEEEKFIKSSDHSEFAPSLARRPPCHSPVSSRNPRKLRTPCGPVFTLVTVLQTWPSEPSEQKSF